MLKAKERKMKESELKFQQSTSRLEEIKKQDIETRQKMGILEMKLDESKRINECPSFLI